MKKVLTLVLSVAMVICLMPAMAFAADSNAATDASADKVTQLSDFADASSIQNKEAVDVLAGLNVINGDENQNFNPTKNLTRAETAVLISTLMRSGDQTALKETATKFNDVAPAYSWASGYIKYGTDQGYINGMTPTTYVPAGNVTKAQLATMLLQILGYTTTDVQTNWPENVNGLATDAGLFTDLDTIGINANLTRDEAAQMIFNALQVNTVTKTIVQGTQASTQGYTPVPNNKNDYDKTSGDVYKPIVKDTQGIQQLVEKLFKNTKVVNKLDKATGSLGHAWTNSDAEDAFTAVYNAGSVAGTVNDKATTGDVYANNDFAAVANNIATVSKIFVNGDEQTDKTVSIPRNGENTLKSVLAEVLDKNLDGATIQLIANNSGKVDQINVTEYYLAKVDNVNEAKGTKDRSIDLDVFGKSGDGVNYITEDFAKDDFVLVAFNSKDGVYAIEKAVATKDAKVDGYTQGENPTVTVDGTKYEYAANYAYKNDKPLGGQSVFKTTYTLYMVNGYVIGAKAADESQTEAAAKDYIVVDEAQYSYKPGTDENLFNDASESSAAIKVKATKLDGTTSIYNLETVKVTDQNKNQINNAAGTVTFNTGDIVYKLGNTFTKLVDAKEANAVSGVSVDGITPSKVYAYTEKDGTITLDPETRSNDKAETNAVSGTYNIAKGAAKVTVGNEDYFADSATVLTTVDAKGNVASYTGYKNFPAVTEGTAYAVVTGNKAVSEILVIGAKADQTQAEAKDYDAVGIYVGQGNVTAAGTEQNFLVNGAVKTYTNIAAGTKLDANEVYGLSNGKTADNKDVVNAAKLTANADPFGYAVVSGKATILNDDYAVVGGQQLNITGDTDAYKLTENGNDITGAEAVALNTKDDFTFVTKTVKDKDGKVTSTSIVEAYTPLLTPKPDAEY